MRRFLAVVLLVLMILPLCLSFTVSAETYIPTRTINLVYDDSGSMITTGGKSVDTWCQAKYAMEVFASMLGENETLNIYYMSDFVDKDKADSAGPKLTLKGSSDASVTEANVKKIHDMVTFAAKITPFAAVEKAYKDLKDVTTDDRWLVVLTDGTFSGTKTDVVQQELDKCAEDGKTNIMMLAMGSSAPTIVENPDKRIYFRHAETTKDILDKLTEICTQIFESNNLTVNNSEVSFNVPMSQLVIFAQGKNVKIEGVTPDGGKAVKPTSNVHVQYSDTATTDLKEYPKDKWIVSDDLNGYVATFNGYFEPGKYKLNVSGADDVQVYYKPNVSIAAYLYNDANEEVTEKDNLVAGTYRVEFGFIDGTTGAKLTDTSLLGDIEYSSSIVNTSTTGDVLEFTAKSGDPITIKEGTLDIDVTAKFLEYNTVNAGLTYQVYCSKDLIFKFDDKPTYTLTTEGFTNPDAPLVLSVQIDDGDGPIPLTQEQWELLGTPKITTTADLGEFKIEKTEEIGKFKVYPTLKDGDPMKTEGGTIPVTVEGQFKQDLSSAYGKLEDSFEISNTISFLERLTDWLKENWLALTIGIIIFLLILGYIPPFKKYLPRKLKKRPVIDCSANKVGVRGGNRSPHGKFERRLLSTIIPYKAETGYVTFSPSPYKKTAQLRAAGGNGMYVTNVRMFAGKQEITFDGMPIEENRTKPYRINAGTNISLRTPEYTYSCYLNR